MIAALGAWCMSASAVGLDFHDLPVSQFAETVFKQVLGRDYVVSSAVAASPERVSISVREVSPDRVLDLASSILRLHGVVVVERHGVLFLEALPPVPPVVDSGRRSESGVDMPAPLMQGFVPGTFPGAAAGAVEVYRPRAQSVEILRSVAKFAGAQVIEGEAGTLPVVVFSGTPDVVERAQFAMRAVDRAPMSVHVRAAIMEVTDSTDSNRSLSGVLSLLSGRLGITIGATGSGNSITFKNTNITAVLSAVDGDSRFRYVAEPSLKVVDRQKARLVVGSEVPVRGALTTDRNGNMIQSVDYRTAGVQLTVEPIIYDDVVIASISQEISSFASTTTSGIDSPTILKRSASTTVDMREGEVIALAGLDESRDSKSRSGLPLMPFSLSRTDSSTRSQIVLLLEVVRGPLDAPAVVVHPAPVVEPPIVPVGDSPSTRL